VRRPPCPMWKRVLLAAVVLVIVLDADPGIYSEGGGDGENGQELLTETEDGEKDADFEERTAQILAELERHPPVLSAQLQGDEGDVDDIPEEEQADIAAQLPPQQPVATKVSDPVAAVKIGQSEESPLPAIPASKSQAKPEKKGQNEFVEFVEPIIRDSNQLKSGQSLDKRVPAAGSYVSHGPQGLLQTGNLLFLAVVTVCVVASVVGVVGGGIYWHGLQKQRAAAEAAEYPHYAPTGPLARGKVRQRGSGPAPMGDKANAYNAQLHHYQQTKAKIISGDGAMPHRPAEAEESDEEEDANNFSVYECPGLAPTGDIEVQNPNFR